MCRTPCSVPLDGVDLTGAIVERRRVEGVPLHLPCGAVHLVEESRERRVACRGVWAGLAHCTAERRRRRRRGCHESLLLLQHHQKHLRADSAGAATCARMLAALIPVCAVSAPHIGRRSSRRCQHLVLEACVPRLAPGTFPSRNDWTVAVPSCRVEEHGVADDVPGVEDRGRHFGCVASSRADEHERRGDPRREGDDKQTLQKRSHDGTRVVHVIIVTEVNSRYHP